jgi:hypothetical protein
MIIKEVKIFFMVWIIPLASLNLHVNVGSWSNRQSIDHVKKCIHDNKIKKGKQKGKCVLMRLKNLDSKDASLFQSIRPKFSFIFSLSPPWTSSQLTLKMISHFIPTTWPVLNCSPTLFLIRQVKGMACPLFQPLHMWCRALLLATLCFFLENSRP